MVGLIPFLALIFGPVWNGFGHAVLDVFTDGSPAGAREGLLID